MARAESELVTALQNPGLDFGLRLRAARQLGRLQSEEGLRALENLPVRPPDSSLRVARLFREYYKRSERSVREALVRAAESRLRAANLDRCSVRRALLDATRSVEERVGLASSVAALGYRECWPELVELVTDSSVNLSFAASQALATLKTRSASRSLMNILRSRPPEHVLRASIDALWWLRERRAAHLLSRILLDKSHEEAVRDRAAEALGSCASRPCHVNCLVEASLDPSKLIKIGVRCWLSALRTRLVTPAVTEAIAGLDSEGTG